MNSIYFILCLISLSLFFSVCFFVSGMELYERAYADGYETGYLIAKDYYNDQNKELVNENINLTYANLYLKTCMVKP